MLRRRKDAPLAPAAASPPPVCARAAGNLAERLAAMRAVFSAEPGVRWTLDSDWTSCPLSSSRDRPGRVFGSPEEMLAHLRYSVFDYQVRLASLPRAPFVPACGVHA